MRQIVEVFNTGVDPEHLLEDDRYLVLDHSLEDLGLTLTQRRILWEEKIAAARSVAFFERVRCNLEKEVDAEEMKIRRSTTDLQRSI